VATRGRANRRHQERYGVSFTTSRSGEDSTSEFRYISSASATPEARSGFQPRISALLSPGEGRNKWRCCASARRTPRGRSCSSSPPASAPPLPPTPRYTHAFTPSCPLLSRTRGIHPLVNLALHGRAFRLSSLVFSFHNKVGKDSQLSTLMSATKFQPTRRKMI
jgi:hypothetical protein